MTSINPTAPRWVRHVKRGTRYLVLGVGRAQVSGVLSDMDAVTIYQGEDGALWCRPPDEFEDGRFVPCEPPQAINPAWPARCTHRLRATGFRAPKSGCMVEECQNGGMARECPMLAAAPPPVAEAGEVVSRPSDMDPATVLRMRRQEDGDLILSIGPASHRIHEDEVEFCAGPGGGMSPHTVRALRALMVAMQADAQRTTPPTSAGSAAAMREASGPTPELAEALAEHLATEHDFQNNMRAGYVWPLHPDDDGFRGPGYVRLIPADVQAHRRDDARRILSFLCARDRHGALTAQPEGEAVERLRTVCRLALAGFTDLAETVADDDEFEADEPAGIAVAALRAALSPAQGGEA